MTPDASSFPYTAVLFDLDGTIADSAPGITSTLAHTLEDLGLPVPAPAALLEWVGPPLPDSFTEKLGLRGAALDEAMTLYRKRYLAQGALDSQVFPGMAELLRKVHEAGIPSSLATSKPERPAILMLDHFGLMGYLDVITGASDDEVRSAKKDVVEEALIRLDALGVDLSRPVLVGDRHHDIEGAAANGVPTIFVEWGYGSVSEQAGATAVVADPDELAAALGVSPTRDTEGAESTERTEGSTGEARSA